MTTKTLGTNAQTTLTALSFLPGTMLPADRATIEQAILDDGQFPAGGGTLQNEFWRAVNSAGPYPGAFGANGLLFIPNRGVLRVQEGDFVGVDGTGWPILVSAVAAASGSWVHT